MAGGQEASGKLDEQPSFPTHPAATEAACVELQGEGGEGLLEVAGASAFPYHAVLVVDFNDNDGGIVS